MIVTDLDRNNYVAFVWILLVSNYYLKKGEEYKVEVEAGLNFVFYEIRLLQNVPYSTEGFVATQQCHNQPMNSQPPFSGIDVILFYIYRIYLFCRCLLLLQDGTKQDIRADSFGHESICGLPQYSL